MKRRRVLYGCSTVVAGLLAGCGGDGEADAETPESTPESTPTKQEVSLEDGSSGSDSIPTETPTEAPTETPTEAPTETPTATPTPTPAGNTHQVNEQFTVGEGDNAVTYRILEYYRSDELGNSASRATADGTFLVVVMEITNPQDDRITLPRNAVRVLSDQTWHKYHRDGSEKIDSDSRISDESLVNQAIRSGKSRTGAIAYDVDPDSSYRLWIQPTGDESTPEHFVPIGDISAVRRL